MQFESSDKLDICEGLPAMEFQAPKLKYDFSLFFVKVFGILHHKIQDWSELKLFLNNVVLISITVK